MTGRVLPGHEPVMLGRKQLSYVLCDCDWRSTKTTESSALAQHEAHVTEIAPARVRSPEVAS